ncbi:hypothetical protein GXW83_11260 [Streptacidiphilus sp. PB12-B1b]|uniref:hypothetical protein n=1 Tax=Streptacidiphilus sp. PB12-B1b TaxID=2705012 RepID=UPI0015FE3801|nr:hypothetical protein [Streptacidiphilus sp. PB12-B1b]QMU76235.1 hypothetical protein GXW83_11260 [Streptacidiphilus sp. PB12-B1b]
MNTRGEHRAAEPGARSRSPRTAALLLVLAVGAAGATWGEVRYAGDVRSHVGGGGGTAVQDGVSMQGSGTGDAVDDVAALRLNDVLPPTVAEAATPTSADGYLATRYQGGSSDDCAEAFTITAPAAASTGCTGFLTADYVEQDRSVYTSVTVFVYPDAATAARAAKALNTPAATGAVTFQQPEAGLPDAALPAADQAPASSPGVQPDAASGSGAPTAPAAPQVQQRVEAVGSAVDVIESAAAGAQPAVAAALSTPTWYLAYTVGAKLAWQ